ncbi:MAG: hypothetical protein ABIP98_04105 [Ginsengibacter sp.]
MRRVYLRGMAISLFVIIISFFNFERLAGSDCIRAIHVVTLLVCGMAIGIFLMNFLRLLRAKKN